MMAPTSHRKLKLLVNGVLSDVPEQATVFITPGGANVLVDWIDSVGFLHRRVYYSHEVLTPPRFHKPRRRKYTLRLRSTKASYMTEYSWSCEYLPCPIIATPAGRHIDERPRQRSASTKRPRHKENYRCAAR